MVVPMAVTMDRSWSKAKTVVVTRSARPLPMRVAITTGRILQ